MEKKSLLLNVEDPQESALLTRLLSGHYRILDPECAAGDAADFTLCDGSAMASERRELVRWRQVAYTDSLTGVLNRRGLEARLNRLLGVCATEPGWLCILDLDDFKKVNDRCGHPVGDALLQKAGKALRSVVRETDVVGRVGGDEFVLYLPGKMTRVQVEQKLDRVREEMAHGRTGPAVRFSAGLARCPDSGRDYATLLRRADQDLYRSKGRKKVGHSHR